MTTKAQHEMLTKDTQAKFPYLIHISHDDLGDWYYCNTDEEISYGGHHYTPALFSIEQPEETTTSIKNTKLSLSIVDTEEDWIATIRNSGHKRFKLELVAAIAYYDGNGLPVIEPIESNEFILTDANWEDLMVSWSVVFDDNMNIQIPCDVAGAANFPGCV